MANHLLAYEEEIHLAKKVHAILSEKTFVLNKIKKLNVLRMSVTSPLCLSHIDYYIHGLKSDILSRIGRIISFLLVMLYLIFTLCRVYWLYHPDKNPLPPLSITVIDLIIGFFYAASAALVIYVIYRLKCHFTHKKTGIKRNQRCKL